MPSEPFDSDDHALGRREAIQHPRHLGSSAPRFEDVRRQNTVRRYDELIFWLSAMGEGSWDSFVNVCRTLQLISNTKQASYIFRRLVLLGYVERSENGSRWCVCPPTIVHKPIDSDYVYLCGQRVPSLLEDFSSLTIVESPQPEVNGPPRIEIRSDITTLCESIGKKKHFCLQDAGVASLKLAEVLPHLRDWISSLPHLVRLNTSNYEIKRWDGEKYLTCTTLYERNGYYYGDSGLYRLTKECDASILELYFDANQQRWLKGDWYGLNFIASLAAGVDSKVIINTDACTLAIRTKSRWPFIYERALVLASGLLPNARTEPGWLIYQGVSIELAQILTDKLGLPLHILGRRTTVPIHVETKIIKPKLSSNPISLPSQVLQRARWLARTAEVLKRQDGAAIKPISREARTSLKRLDYLPTMKKLCSMASAPATLAPHFEALARLINRLDIQQNSSQKLLDN